VAGLYVVFRRGTASATFRKSGDHSEKGEIWGCAGDDALTEKP